MSSTGFSLLWRRSAGTRRRAPRATASRSQLLESRQLLSGNVAATFQNGVWKLRGDRHDNAVEVRVQQGNVELRGLNGTTINGRAAIVLQSGSTTLSAGLDVRLQRGADVFLISPGVTVRGALRVVDRQGSNFLAAEQATLQGGASVRFGRGADNVLLEATTIVGQLDLRMGAGSDVASITGGSVGALTARLGTGGDRLFVDDASAGSMLLHGGAGPDSILVRDSEFNGTVQLRAGGGADFATFQGVTAAEGLRLQLGAGNDRLALRGATNTGTGAVLNGGSGADALLRESQVNGAGAADRFEREEISTAVLQSQTVGLETVRDGLRRRRDALRGAANPAVTLSLTANAGTVSSSGTLATSLSQLQVTGQTTPLATVSFDLDGDGLFDDATATADATGALTYVATLAPGRQQLAARATSGGAVSATQTLNLHRAVGTVVRMTTNLGVIDVELFDDDAPRTVENFLSYLPDYASSMIHRTVAASTGGISIIQGGGFVLDEGEIQQITARPTIANEFLAANSNVAGTLSMALPAGQPDGGDSQWFFNTGDNSTLDSQRHTVFGRIIGDGLNVATNIVQLLTANLNPLTPNDGGALQTVPLRAEIPVTRPLTGSVSVSSGEMTITGAGTRFLSELEVGATVRVGGFTSVVTAIASETLLTVAAPAASTATGAALFTQARPTPAELVLIQQVAVLLTPPA